MNWHILGVGAIGSLWARKLKRVGYEPTLIFRDIKSQERFHSAGSAISYNESETCERIGYESRALPNPGPISNLIIATKAFDLETAFKACAPSLKPGAQIYLLANGYGPQQQIAKEHPEHLIWAMSTTDGANVTSRFNVNVAGQGETQVGPLTREAQNQDAAITLLSEHQLTDEIDSVLWSKLCVNACINPMTLKYRCRNGALLERSERVLELEKLASELEQLNHRLDRRVRFSNLLEEVKNVCRLTANNRSSMLQDYESGRKTEIDQITGTILTEGRRIGLQLNTHQRLYDDITSLSPAKDYRI